MSRAVLLAALVALAPRPAHANCSTTSLGSLAGTGANVSPSTNINGWIFFAADQTLYAFSSTGAKLGSFSTGGAPIEGFPTVAQLADGNYYIFITDQKAQFYKLTMGTNVAGKGTLAKVTSFDASRPPAVCSSDSLAAAPSLQIKKYSTGWASNSDLGFLLTHHNCGDISGNMVIAVDLMTMTQAWAFNQYGEGGEMNYGSQSCAVDYELNVIYCGTAQVPGRAQNTVWAIDSATGHLYWSGNYNSVVNRPQLQGRTPSGQMWKHLYVADTLGLLHAIDVKTVNTARHTVKEDWTLPLFASSSTFVTQNIWAEFRGSYKNLIFIADTAGVLHAVQDYQTSGAPLWDQNFSGYSTFFPLGTPKAMSLGSVSPDFGKLYIGLNNGMVAQVDIPSKNVEGVRTIVAGAATVVTDPTLFVAGTAPGSDIDSMVAISAAGTSATGQLFCVPMEVGSMSTSLGNCTVATELTDCVTLDSPANCTVGNNCCSVGRCWVDPNLGGFGTCYSEPQAGTIACNASDPCITSATCQNGSCSNIVWNTADTVNCMANANNGFAPCSKYASTPYHDLPCGGGSNKCRLTAGAGPSCADTSTSISTCGSLWRTCDDLNGGAGTTQDWGGNRLCRNGVCVRDTLRCATTTNTLPSDPVLSSSLQNADGISFERLGNGVSCSAWMSSYSTAVTPTSASTSGLQITPGAQCTGGLTLCGSCGQSSTLQLTPAGTLVPTAGVVFADPVPQATNGPYKVTSVRVIASGVCNAGDSVTVQINGVSLGTTASPGSCQCSTRSLLTGLCTTRCQTVVDRTDSANVGSYWSYGGNQVVKFVSTTGGSGIAEVQLVVTYQQIADQAVRVSHNNTGGQVSITLTAAVHPGYMNGIAVTPYVDDTKGAAADVLTSFIPRPQPPVNLLTTTNFVGLGRWDHANLMINQPLSQPPKVTLGNDYVLVPDFNYGMSPPAVEGPAVNVTNGGRVFVGNFNSKGDVVMIQNQGPGASGFAVSPVWNTAACDIPPWCTYGGPCTTPCQDRVTAVGWPIAPPQTDPAFQDRLLRIGHAHHDANGNLLGVNVDLFDILKGIRQTIDLRTAGPFASLPCSGAPNIQSIMSLSVDGLNRTNDTYVEVKEKRPGGDIHYILRINGADSSVRPLFDYTTDVNAMPPACAGVTYPGLYSDQHMGQTLGSPGSEGRITTSSISHIHRIIPVDPTVAAFPTVSSHPLTP